MRRQTLMKKGSKMLCIAIISAMLMVGMTACGSSASAGQTTQTKTQTETGTGSTAEANSTGTGSTAEATDSVEEAVSYFGQITAIDGNSITVALANMLAIPSDAQLPEVTEGVLPEKPSGELEKPVLDEDVKLPEAPSGEAANGEVSTGGAPSGEAPANGEKTSGDKGQKRAEMGQRELELTGETLTVEINDSTIITVNGAEAAASDLKADDTVTIIMEGDTVNSIIAGFMHQGGEAEGQLPSDASGSKQ